MLRKIEPEISEKELQADLETYRKYALDLGGDARIISARDVIVDERVLAKCMYPKCHHYGACLNCPPYAMPPEQTRRVVDKFNYGILVKLGTPTDAQVGKASDKSSKIDNSYHRKHAEIVAKIESRAFYDGHYLSLGFGGGSCRNYLCNYLECEGLKTGQPCRKPLLARSSMEAVGMDVYRMVARVGWDIYPIGKRTNPADAPHGVRIGLVLID
jgi:predicted metal-binding protein